MARFKVKEICLAFVASLISLIGAFFIIEGYFIFKNWDRSVALGTQFDSQLGWVNIPNYSFTSDKRTYTTNKLGLRSEPLNPSANHVLVLGDSVAYGAGVNDDETFSYLLNKMFPNYQILNLAVSGYGVDQYYLALKNLINKTNPKLIITNIYTGNDLADTRRDNLFGISKPLFKIQNGELVNINSKISRFSCPNLITRSWINSIMKKAKLQSLFCSNLELDLSSAKLTIKNLLQQIHRIGKSKNAETIFVLSPTLIGTQWLNCYWSGKPDNCEGLDSGFHHLYVEFKEILEENKFQFLDLNNSFLLNSKGSTKELVSLYNQNGKDFHHYSPKGHHLVAKYLGNFINHDLKASRLKNKTAILSSEENENKKLAFSYLQNGNFKKSLELIKKIIVQRTNLSELYFLLGLAHQGLIQYDDALKAFRKAIELNPSDFKSHNLVGLTYFKLGKNFEAIVAFQNSLKIMPDFADTHFNLALALDGVQKGKQALTHMSISKNLYRRDKNDLMAGLAEKEINAYLTKYKIPASAINNQRLTNVLSNLSEIKKLENILKEHPQDLERRYQLAQKLLDMNQAKLAQLELETLLKAYPTGAQFWNDLGFLLMKLNRFEEASEKLEAALKINPDFAGANFNLATVMEIRGNKEKAITHLKKALKTFRQFDNARFVRLSEEALNRLQ